MQIDFSSIYVIMLLMAISLIVAHFGATLMSRFFSKFFNLDAKLRENLQKTREVRAVQANKLLNTLY